MFFGLVLVHMAGRELTGSSLHHMAPIPCADSAPPASGARNPPKLVSDAAMQSRPSLFCCSPGAAVRRHPLPLKLAEGMAAAADHFVHAPLNHMGRTSNFTACVVFNGTSRSYCLRSHIYVSFLSVAHAHPHTVLRACHSLLRVELRSGSASCHSLSPRAMPACPAPRSCLRTPLCCSPSRECSNSSPSSWGRCVQGRGGNRVHMRAVDVRAGPGRTACTCALWMCVCMCLRVCARVRSPWHLGSGKSWCVCSNLSVIRSCSSGRLSESMLD